jgi:hypothetical protein
MTSICRGHRLLEIKVVSLGIGTWVGVDVHMHKVECELMGGSRGDKVRIWTDVPLHHPPFKGAASRHMRIARRWPDLL